MIKILVSWGGDANNFQELRTGHRGNMGTDFPGPFLRPQEAPGGLNKGF